MGSRHRYFHRSPAVVQLTRPRRFCCSRFTQPTFIFLWLFISVSGAPTASAQETDDTSNQFWFAYQYERRLGEHSRFSGSLGLEELLSSGLLLGDWSRYYLTGAASYDLTRYLRLGGGLGLYQTFQPEADNNFEVRLWQQATVYWPDVHGPWRRFVLMHRLKLEERFSNTTDWGLALRFRYRLSTSIPLNTHDLETRSFFLPLSVELFADVGEEVPEFFAATNRLSAGIGYVMSERWTLDLRYVRQSSRDTLTDTFNTTDHIIYFSARTSVRIKDLLKSH